jgi:hypothetical protein
MPEFPGVQRIRFTLGLLDNFQQRACSLPPEPTTMTFFLSITSPWYFLK